MTTDEIRDELARLKGWTRICGVTGMLKEDGDLHLKWKLRHHEQWDHPYPPTLDGANAAVPECYHWERFNGRWFAYRGTPQKPKHVIQTGVQYGICVPDTGDPVHDLYALALACVRAEEAKR